MTDPDEPDDRAIAALADMLEHEEEDRHGNA